MSIPPEPSSIRDNCFYGKAADYLCEKIRPDAELSFVSAYFTIFAYDSLREKLDSARHLRFLFGEPRFIASVDPEKNDPKSFKIEDDTLALANRLSQRAVARSCADWIRQKVEIHSIARPNFLHGKLYHIQNGPVADALLGSSNFTVSGLGLGVTPNIELNLEVNDKRDLAALRKWFDALWNDSALTQDVKAEVLAYLAELYRDNSPEFIYYKTLFHIFENLLADACLGDDRIRQTSLLETKIWNALFDFQKDGAKGAINKILAHNGCILADSVGLGKTYEALAVIKYFELRNQNVLVLCPKKLRENWVVYRRNDLLNPFVSDRFRFDVLSHTDLSREDGMSGSLDLSTLNWANYDLVVIDESHNFRNNSEGRRDEDGNLIRKSRYKRLLDDILRAGVKSKVLLLSATPVNNTLRDLRNQLYLVSEGDDAAFAPSIGITSLEQTLKIAQQQFTLWARKSAGQRTTRSLLDSLNPGFFKLLDNLTIARSRKHIQRYYKQAVEKIGGFPRREKPVSVYPEIDKKGRFMSYEALDAEISKYSLSLYNPFSFVQDEYRHLYEKSVSASSSFTQAGREKILIGMMKVGFLKRLESSVYSFARTMQRTDDKIMELERRIRAFQKRQKQASAHPGELPVGREDELELEYDEEIANEEIGKRLKYKLVHLNLDAWLEALAKDKQQLFTLYSQANSVAADDDAKLGELKKIITGKLGHPTIDKNGCPNRKVLIFTAYADTAEYLYNSVHKWVRDEFNAHAALVTGSGANQATLGDTDFNAILTNFSPCSKHRSRLPRFPQDREIDILIATDCISEGQNLQDCDFLVNYDIHWNPVRIIQRFGRIDRIGSVNDSIKLVNFWPTPNLDHYIKLKTRVEARMALVDISATFDDNLLSQEGIDDLIKADLHYRDRQLRRLKEEILDLEDLGEDVVSLTEFSLEDFRADLLRYLEINREGLQNAPLGIHAVVPADDICRPGVIFCLRQRGADAPANPQKQKSISATQPDGKTNGNASSSINPLQPHYLVYVHDDGNIRLTFAQPKQILDTLRHLCAGQTEPFRDLCATFDRETANGTDMTRHSALLERAVASIAATFRQRAGHVLTSDRNALLPLSNTQPDPARLNDFELVTWAIIR
jgi:SNF2 family DNA or RNA helicase